MKLLLRYGLFLFLAGAAFWTLPFHGSAQEQLDPLVVASDTHRLLFENKLVRVIEAKVPPGKIEPKHRHPHGVTVYLASYEIDQKTFPAGTSNRAARKIGTVSWSEGIVHEIKNVGKTELHSIRIELKY